jgi:DNA-binding SARP family transcriptional activator
LFWPDSTDEQALTNLRRELHHLRAVLHTSGALVVTSRDLCWRDTPAVTVDVRVFGRERRAALAASVRSDPAGVLAHAAAIDAGRPTAEWPGGRPVITTTPEPYADWGIEIITAT